MAIRAPGRAIQSLSDIHARAMGASARRYPDDAGTGRVRAAAVVCMNHLDLKDIYLPLSRLLSIYVDATHRALQAQRQFSHSNHRAAHHRHRRSASAAVGKSTTARVLQALLTRWSPRPKVEMVTTRFPVSQRGAQAAGHHAEKGFPESYDLPTLLAFLSDIKAGRRPVPRAMRISPMTSSESGRGRPPGHSWSSRASMFCRPASFRAMASASVVSDFFDFSVYIDAEKFGAARLVCPALPRASGRRRSSIRDRTSIAMRRCPTRKAHGNRQLAISGTHQPCKSRGQHRRHGRARR